MINRRTMLWALGAVAGSTAAGCSAASKPIQGWDDRFGADKAPGQKVSPRRLAALKPGRRGYVVVSRDGEPTEAAGGAAQTVGDEDSEHAFPVRISRARQDTEFPYRRRTPDGRIEHLGFAEDGTLHFGVVEDLEHEALTKYETPLPMIPAELNGGEPVTFEAELTVLDRSNPDRQKDRGSCEQTITYEADQRVICPPGRFNCLRIRSEYRAELTLATVRQTSVGWYAPGVGMVAEQRRERVRAFIINTDGRRRILLREKP